MTTQQLPQLDEEFYSEEYTESVIRHPYAQLVNKQKGYGLFIPHEESKRITFRANTNMEEYSLPLADGSFVAGYRFKLPRVAVIRETPLYLIERETNRFAGYFEGQLYQTGNYKTQRKVLFFLLNEVNEPYHDEPFQLTLKGVAGTSFSAELSKFRKAMNNLFSEVYKDKFQKKQGNKKFNALMVFEPLFQSVQRGEGSAKNWVCHCGGFTTPNTNNLPYLFAGYKPETKKLLTDWFDELADFEVLNKPQVPAQTEDLTDVLLNDEEIPY